MSPDPFNLFHKNMWEPFTYERGPPQKRELFSLGWAPCSTAISRFGECSRNPTVSKYQLALWWEAMFSLSEFFLRLFQHICPFHDGWFAHTMLSVQQFLSTNGMAPTPHPLYSPNLAPSDVFCFCGWIKSSKGNVLPKWKRWKKKIAETQKAIKISKFKKCFEQWKKSLNRYIAANGEYIEGDWSLNM